MPEVMRSCRCVKDLERDDAQSALNLAGGEQVRVEAEAGAKDVEADPGRLVVVLQVE